jgi:hypothetical protein
MKNRLRQAGAAIAIMGMLGGLAIAEGGPAAERGHPHLEAARRTINRALADCKAARADEKKGEFGGHRDKAEDLLNQAKGELDQAAEYANSHK